APTTATSWAWCGWLNLFQHAVGPDQQHRRDRQSHRFRSLEIHGQVVPRRIFRGQVRRLRTLEDLVEIDRGSLERIFRAWPVREQSAVANVQAALVHRRNALLRREFDDV